MCDNHRNRLTVWHMQSTLMDRFNLLEKNKFEGLKNFYLGAVTVILIAALRCLGHKWKRRIFHPGVRKHNEWVEVKVARNGLYLQYLVNHRIYKKL